MTRYQIEIQERWPFAVLGCAGDWDEDEYGVYAIELSEAEVVDLARVMAEFEAWQARLREQSV